MADDKRQLALLVSITEQFEFWHAEASFMTQENGELRGLSASTYRNDSLEIYADLHVTCQSDATHAKQGLRAYGWQVEYRPHTVTLPRAQGIVKILSHIERKLEDLSEMAGTPPEFVSYLLRVASIFKIRSFARVGKLGSLWNNSEITWMTPDATRSFIEKAEAAWIAKHQDKAAVADLEVAQ